MISTYYNEEKYSWTAYGSRAFDMYFGGYSICVLDIETTGLSPKNSHFVLGSLLFLGGGEARLKQFFAEGLTEEKQLLEEYIREARAFDALLTYNGKRFDVPFLLSRADRLELDVTGLPYNLDMYLVLNDHSSLRKLLPNLRQKSVEDFMGLWQSRTDRISGGESAALYHRYLYLKEALEDTKECMDLMLLHNKDDVLQLGRLLPALEKADFHRAMHYLGFPVASGTKKLTVESIKIEGRFLTASGAQTANPVDFISYEAGEVKFTKKNSGFEIKCPLLSKAGLKIIDLAKLRDGLSDEFKGFPNYESGYLAVKNNNEIKFAEANYFVKTFLLNILKDIPEGD